VYRITPEDRVLQWFSPNFDGWHCDVMLGLTAGATLVIAPPPHECIGASLMRILRVEAVTVALLTPTAWQTIGADELRGLTALRLAGTAGEVCPAATVARLSAPGRRVLNLYGPAEAAVWSTWHDCHPEAGDPPIGTAIPNRHAYVLDAAGRPVAAGEVGELWLGGLGIGRYLHQPRLMRSRFRPDPLAIRPGQLMYATGDLCRWRADGRIDYVGRTDRQVKIRGQRIELEEIERVLGALPGISHAGVHLVDERLVARVVAGPGAQGIDPESIRSALRGRLHSAMVPAVIEVVDRPELSTTGKLAPLGQPVTRQPIPVTSQQTARPTAPRPRPRPVVDAKDEARLIWRLARTFASCLEVPQTRVRVDSDFFDLGGDSLSVAELLTAVEDDLGVVLDVASLVSQATPQGIAHTILERRAAPSAA
jgi:acyl-coenzyme A synthetase/AMP-(fatty) acid ligase/acyl carrier protein